MSLGVYSFAWSLRMSQLCWLLAGASNCCPIADVSRDFSLKKGQMHECVVRVAGTLQFLAFNGIFWLNTNAESAPNEIEAGDTKGRDD